MGRSCTILALATLALIVEGGCLRSPSQVAPAEPPALPVSHPVQRQITDYVNFTGRTDAVESVDIRPRVTGYLVQMPFKEGSEVNKGDFLFEIDPAPYQAQLDQAESQVALNQASLKLAQTTYARDLPLAAKGAVTQQELDQDKAAMDEADARLKATQASLKVYKLNLGFTRVVAPISGQVSRYYLTKGNLVNQDQTLLTTVVSLDPIHAYFDMDEATLLQLRRARNAGLIQPNPDGLFPVYVGLQGEEGYPHQGTVNFVNNQVNAATGSITLRGELPNPKPEGGVRLLSPGMFVRVHLPIGQPHKALLVIDRAIGSEQGQKFVYVVDADHKIQYRRVSTGALQEDGLRVITKGLNADDWILVGGIQQVRTQMQIQPEPREMPVLVPPATKDDVQNLKPEGQKSNNEIRNPNPEKQNNTQPLKSKS
jgi:multidrug efflux system membrane fusion protein